MSYDPREDLRPSMDHYIGIDVGTGSARACIMNSTGDIVGLASENIGLWQPQNEYYVRNYRIPAPAFQSNNLAGTIDHGHLAPDLWLDSHGHASAQH